jgi:hypothetical protein
MSTYLTRNLLMYSHFKRYLTDILDTDDALVYSSIIEKNAFVEGNSEYKSYTV